MGVAKIKGGYFTTDYIKQSLKKNFNFENMETYYRTRPVLFY
jgi:hypothetical protein